MCMMSGEMIDHHFLHCPMTMVLWHRLFSVDRVDWVSLKNIPDTFPSNAWVVATPFGNRSPFFDLDNRREMQ